MIKIVTTLILHCDYSPLSCDTLNVVKPYVMLHKLISGTSHSRTSNNQIQGLQKLKFLILLVALYGCKMYHLNIREEGKWIENFLENNMVP
jgi:hypothetical protein